MIAGVVAIARITASLGSRGSGSLLFLLEQILLEIALNDGRVECA